VTITDSSGCTAEAEVTIVKSAIYAQSEKKDNSCAGNCKGEIIITIQNEDGSEKIAWSDGGTGLIRTGLCAGDYQWTITDGYGNSLTSPVVTISTPEPIKLAIEVKGESCENKGDGQATVSINGGTPNYTIKWDGVTGTETTSLSTGIHMLAITDANGCLTDTVVLLPGLASAKISTEVKDAICESGGELTIQTSASEIIDVLINGTKYSIDKELTIRPLPPAMYKIEQQINDSCFVFKEDVIIESLIFITAGNILTEIEVKEGEQVAIDISTLEIGGRYTIKWEGVQQNNCEQTDVFGNCLKYVYVPDGPHEVSAYILSDQGCDSLITFYISVLVDNDVFIPNVFGVGNNNVFKPTDKTGKTKIEAFEIYDRWGNLVYIERAVEISAIRGWDGTFNGSRAEQGVYVYHLKTMDTTGKIKNKIGDVTLVR
jgi:gliding motility-associated-like protein